MTTLPIAIAICGYFGYHRVRVGLPMFGWAIFLVGSTGAILEQMGYDLAALSVGLIYAVLYLRSQVVIVRYGLPSAW
jgi:hypothetical protein